MRQTKWYAGVLVPVMVVLLAACGGESAESSSLPPEASVESNTSEAPATGTVQEQAACQKYSCRTDDDCTLYCGDTARCDSYSYSCGPRPFGCCTP